MTTKEITPLESIEILDSNQQEVIYADRIVNFTFGLATSKLLLGIETASQKQGTVNVTPTKTIIIPTLSLLEALDFMMKTVDENTELKQKITDGLEIYRNRINRTDN